MGGSSWGLCCRSLHCHWTPRAPPPPPCPPTPPLAPTCKGPTGAAAAGYRVGVHHRDLGDPRHVVDPPAASRVQCLEHLQAAAGATAGQQARGTLNRLPSVPHCCHSLNRPRFAGPQAALRRQRLTPPPLRPTTAPALTSSMRSGASSTNSSPYTCAKCSCVMKPSPSAAATGAAAKAGAAVLVGTWQLSRVASPSRPHPHTARAHCPPQPASPARPPTRVKAAEEVPDGQQAGGGALQQRR